MAGHASTEISPKTLWDGKISPFSTSYGKLMMWYFLVSDALTFGGLLVSYGFVRHNTQGTWPIGEETFSTLPFLGHGYPLVYVALMTFILIISSVTMVLAVEAGHRMDRRGVTRWLLATIIGGFFFLGSQAWEWYHFIHGSEFGRVELADGSQAIVHGDFGAIENFKVIHAGAHHKEGEVIKGPEGELMHQFQHAAAEGQIKNGLITLHDGSVAEINKKKDEHLELEIKKDGDKYRVNAEPIKGADAEKLYYQAIYSGEKGRVVYGANLQENEYGVDEHYGQFFFFITGFHGFHVFSGVLINIIILIGVIRGIYHRRGHYEMVEKTGLYWHFVDLVWVFVFTFFYLV